MKRNTLKSDSEEKPESFFDTKIKVANVSDAF